eukprot:2934603-Rhodomonas_salina.1
MVGALRAGNHDGFRFEQTLLSSELEERKVQVDGEVHSASRGPSRRSSDGGSQRSLTRGLNRCVSDHVEAFERSVPPVEIDLGGQDMKATEQGDDDDGMLSEPRKRIGLGQEQKQQRTSLESVVTVGLEAGRVCGVVNLWEGDAYGFGEPGGDLNARSAVKGEREGQAVYARDVDRRNRPMAAEGASHARGLEKKDNRHDRLMEASAWKSDMKEAARRHAVSVPERPQTAETGRSQLSIEEALMGGLFPSRQRSEISIITASHGVGEAVTAAAVHIPAQNIPIVQAIPATIARVIPCGIESKAGEINGSSRPASNATSRAGGDIVHTRELSEPPSYNVRVDCTSVFSTEAASTLAEQESVDSIEAQYSSSQQPTQQTMTEASQAEHDLRLEYTLLGGEAMEGDEAGRSASCEWRGKLHTRRTSLEAMVGIAGRVGGVISVWEGTAVEKNDLKLEEEAGRMVDYGLDSEEDEDDSEIGQTFDRDADLTALGGSRRDTDKVAELCEKVAALCESLSIASSPLAQSPSNPARQLDDIIDAPMLIESIQIEPTQAGSRLKRSTPPIETIETFETEPRLKAADENDPGLEVARSVNDVQRGRERHDLMLERIMLGGEPMQLEGATDGSKCTSRRSSLMSVGGGGFGGDRVAHAAATISIEGVVGGATSKLRSRKQSLEFANDRDLFSVRVSSELGRRVHQNHMLHGSSSFDADLDWRQTEPIFDARASSAAMLPQRLTVHNSHDVQAPVDTAADFVVPGSPDRRSVAQTLNDVRARRRSMEAVMGLAGKVKGAIHAFEDGPRQNNSVSNIVGMPSSRSSLSPPSILCCSLPADASLDQSAVRPHPTAWVPKLGKGKGLSPQGRVKQVTPRVLEVTPRSFDGDARVDQMPNGLQADPARPNSHSDVEEARGMAYQTKVSTIEDDGTLSEQELTPADITIGSDSAAEIQGDENVLVDESPPDFAAAPSAAVVASSMGISVATASPEHQNEDEEEDLHRRYMLHGSTESAARSSENSEMETVDVVDGRGKVECEGESVSPSDRAAARLRRRRKKSMETVIKTEGKVQSFVQALMQAKRDKMNPSPSQSQSPRPESAPTQLANDGKEDIQLPADTTSAQKEDHPRQTSSPQPEANTPMHLSETWRVEFTPNVDSALAPSNTTHTISTDAEQPMIDSDHIQLKSGGGTLAAFVQDDPVSPDRTEMDLSDQASEQSLASSESLSSDVESASVSSAAPQSGYADKDQDQARSLGSPSESSKIEGARWTQNKQDSSNLQVTKSDSASGEFSRAASFRAATSEGKMDLPTPSTSGRDYISELQDAVQGVTSNAMSHKTRNQEKTLVLSASISTVSKPRTSVGGGEPKLRSPPPFRIDPPSSVLGEELDENAHLNYMLHGADTLESNWQETHPDQGRQHPRKPSEGTVHIVLQGKTEEESVIETLKRLRTRRSSTMSAVDVHESELYLSVCDQSRYSDSGAQTETTILTDSYMQTPVESSSQTDVCGIAKTDSFMQTVSGAGVQTTQLSMADSLAGPAFHEYAHSKSDVWTASAFLSRDRVIDPTSRPKHCDPTGGNANLHPP